MIGNPPYLRYDRCHHPLWVFHEFMRQRKIVVLLLLVLLVGVLAWSSNPDPEFLLLFGLPAFGVLLVLVGRVVLIIVDWRLRSIRLYSDGRLDYEYGILFRKGKSVSLRFGTVQYIYHDRIGTWLDCADLLLPFEAGVITDIADFRHFWDIAQGRI